MTNTNYSEYQNFSTNGVLPEDNFAKELKKGGFVIDDGFDELDALRLGMYRARFNKDALSMTIAPTNDCQFACVYCYERDVLAPKYMDISTQDKIVDILERRKRLISDFSVVWYGGEPLMAFDIVERLSRRFIEICDENRIRFNAIMITNGYMLTPETLKGINEAKISMLQITLDGLAAVHDKMRPLKCGGKTFDTIIQNLIDGYDLLPSVALRVNIDKDNMHSGEKMYSYLKERDMLDKVRPYLGKIISEANTYNVSQCLNMCEFSELHYDFLTQTSDEDVHGLVDYPTLKSSFCGADSDYSFVVDADGWLYKCWCDMGNSERRVGSVNGGYVNTNRRLCDYLFFDPTLDEVCKNCDVLPLCMGGCPYKRMSGSNDICSNHKYILGKCLLDAVEFFKRKRTVPVEE